MVPVKATVAGFSWRSIKAPLSHLHFGSVSISLIKLATLANTPD